MTAHIKKTTEEVIETTLWHEDQISKLKEKIIGELRKNNFIEQDNRLLNYVEFVDEAIKIVEQA